MQSLAVASSAGGSSAYSWLIILIPLVLIGYLFLMQRRRSQAMQSAQSKLSVGEEVSTTSGLLGTIVAIQDGLVHLEISPGVVVRFAQRAVVPRAMVGAARLGSVQPDATDAGARSGAPADSTSSAPAGQGTLPPATPSS